MQRELEKPSKNPCEPPKSATTSLPGMPVTETAVSVPEHLGKGGSPAASSCSSCRDFFLRSSRCRSLKKSAPLP